MECPPDKACNITVKAFGRETKRATKLDSRLLLAAGFGGVLFILTLVVLGAVAPNYDPLRDTISTLEFTPLGAAQRTNFFVFGLLLCAFAVALGQELGSRPVRTAHPLVPTSLRGRRHW